VVELIQGYDNDCLFCEKSRLKPIEDWHRDSASSYWIQGRIFSWRRFLYSKILIDASCLCKTEVAKYLIQSDVCNVSAMDVYGNTALIYAAFKGQTEIVKLILQKDQGSIDI